MPDFRNAFTRLISPEGADSQNNLSYFHFFAGFLKMEVAKNK